MGILPLGESRQPQEPSALQIGVMIVKLLQIGLESAVCMLRTCGACGRVWLLNYSPIWQHRVERLVVKPVSHGTGGACQCEPGPSHTREGFGKPLLLIFLASYYKWSWWKVYDVEDSEPGGLESRPASASGQVCDLEMACPSLRSKGYH